MLIFLFATHNIYGSAGFVVVLAHAIPFVSHSFIDVTLVDVEHEALRDFLIRVSDKGCHPEALLVHADPKGIKGYFLVLLLSFFHLLEDVSHIELHASDEGHFEDECTHEIIEHVAALFLEVHGFVLLEIVKDLVVSHC